MRVLFWTRRLSAPRGGDLVALENTITALQTCGVECDISDDPAHDLSPYTLVHLYNLAPPSNALEYVARAIQDQIPLVASPIYWSHRQWLDAHVNATPATRPEFFLGDLSPAVRELSQRVLLQSEALAQAVHQVACEAAARLFLYSNAEGDLLARDFGASPEKFRTTHVGVDPSFANGNAERFAAAFGLRDFVFSAARIEERKNTIGIIRAWRDENTPLVLAGTVRDAAYFELCQREASAQVHFIGSLTPAQVADADAAARVHVLAGWWEEAGIAALEAGLAGCNLVMTKNGPAHEYLGDACFICDPADVNSIRQAIGAAYRAPRQTTLAARLRESFTWENTAEILCESYNDIAAQPAKFVPTVSAEAWSKAAVALSHLLDTREEYLLELEKNARETAEWAHQLEQRAAREKSWTLLGRARRKTA